MNLIAPLRRTSLVFAAPLITAALFAVAFAAEKAPLPADHDERMKAGAGHVYALPYRGAHRVSEHWGGPTHKGGMYYCLDFPMPRGTPLYAIRGGTVGRVEEDNEELTKAEKTAKTQANKANSVTIIHGDGTRSLYGHLSEDGIVVKHNQKVAEGDLIGYSGNTGHSSGPHLHLAVYHGKKTVPVKFKTKEDGDSYLKGGARFTNPAFPGDSDDDGKKGKSKKKGK